MFKQYFESYSAIRIQKEHYKYIDFMENNSIIIDMIDRKAKDFEFKDQISNAKRETKEFINAIIKTFELIDLKKNPITS